MTFAISGRTALAGVLGDPVRHSLSPAMHNAALRALELDWVYLALPVPAAALATVVPALAAMDCRGLNVTLPHKHAVATLAEELTPLARRVGAVNTLVRRPGGGWRGTNTDLEGFLAPLRERPGPPPRRAVVLGCGGSARAVVAGLVELGLETIAVAGRRQEALAGFVDSCRGWAPQLHGLHWPQLDGALAGAALVVNTTPVGMAAAGDPGAAERCPLSPAQLDALPTGATVYDLIYTPRPTALLQAAAARGGAVLDGLEMLVQQGAASLRLWSGRAEVPVEAMRGAAAAALAG
jgi:shikimate dehydrogenase